MVPIVFENFISRIEYLENKYITLSFNFDYEKILQGIYRTEILDHRYVGFDDLSILRKYQIYFRIYHKHNHWHRVFSVCIGNAKIKMLKKGGSGENVLLLHESRHLYAHQNCIPSLLLYSPSYLVYKTPSLYC